MCRRADSARAAASPRSARRARASRARRRRPCASLGEPAPSSSTSSVGRPEASSSRTSARLALGVAGDVGQRLLGDAVEHELGVAAELRQPGWTWTSTSSSECSATRSPSTCRALASPRSSSASGRSRRAIRRTSSRLSRAVSWASRTPLTRRFGHVARHTAELQHDAGQRSARRRRGAPGRRAAARPPARPARGATLSRRSASSRSSISLNAAASSAASESPPPTSSRWPGSSGSIRRANAVSCRSGASARRSRSRLNAEHQRQTADEDRQLADGDVARARREDERRDRARGREHGGIADGEAPEECGTAGGCEHGLQSYHRRAFASGFGFGHHRHASRSVLEGVWPRTRRQ